MEVKHKYKKVRSKGKSTFKNELRYIFIITFICLILAFGLALITGKVPSFLDRTIQKQADQVVSEKVKDIENETTAFSLQPKQPEPQ